MFADKKVTCQDSPDWILILVKVAGWEKIPLTRAGCHRVAAIKTYNQSQIRWNFFYSSKKGLVGSATSELVGYRVILKYQIENSVKYSVGHEATKLLITC